MNKGGYSGALPVNNRYPGLQTKLGKRPVHDHHQAKERLLRKRLHIVSLLIKQEEDIFLLFSKYAGELTGMVAAEGVSVNYMGQMRTYGDVPPLEDIEEIILWLDEQHFDDLYHVDSLSKHVSRAVPLKKAATGIMAIKLSEGQYLIWYRPGIFQSTSWQQHEIEIIKIFGNYLSHIVLKSRP